MIRFGSLALLFLLACSCRNAPAGNGTIRIIASRRLENLPSASGITRSGNAFLVNSDNAPFLYVLNSEGKPRDSLQLLHEDTRLHQISKPQKPDYEAATIVDWEGRRTLLLLGSGTISPHRDSLLIIDPDNPAAAHKADLRPFYNRLIESGIPAESLNIEAAAASGTRLFLFNRGNNAIIRVDRDTFLNAMLRGSAMPRISISLQSIPLPAVKGYAAGISGATMLDDSTVLFCGSVEATTDWAKDGAILGSGIGFLRVRGSGPATLLRWTMLTDAAGALLREKLEGIELLRLQKQTVSVRCVTDNDNGSSTILDLEVPLPAGLSGR